MKRVRNVPGLAGAILLCGASAVLIQGASAAPPKSKKKPTAAKKAPAKKPAAQKAPVKTASTAGMEPLQIVLPKPAFKGTPKNIKGNPELPVKRGAILVPKGTTVISRGKPVTSSDEAPIIGTADLITDGDKEANEGAWVELGPGKQWVQIDLKGKFNIYGLALWHYHGEARVYHDVIVKVADDADFIENVKTVYNNDQDNSSGEGLGKNREFLEHSDGKFIDLRGKGVKGRYVRLYSKGNTSDDQNHYTEVEVYGTPAK